MEKKYILTAQAFKDHAPAELHGAQFFIAPYLPQLMTLWWCVFFATLIFLLGQLRASFLRSKKAHNTAASH